MLKHSESRQPNPRFDAAASIIAMIAALVLAVWEWTLVSRGEVGVWQSSGPLLAWLWPYTNVVIALAIAIGFGVHAYRAWYRAR